MDSRGENGAAVIANEEWTSEGMMKSHLLLWYDFQVGHILLLRNSIGFKNSLGL